MEKQSENQDFTPESTVHLWSVPRKHRNKPSKLGIVQQIFKEVPLLRKVELLPLSLDDLERLSVSISTEILEKAPSTRAKIDYINFLKPLGLEHPEKLPVASLKVISEYVSRNYA